MTELNKWLKDMLISEYGVTDINEDWGNLIVNGQTFMIGENNNPYLAYKYSAYYDNKGKDRQSFSLGNEYNTPLLREIIERVLHIVPISKSEKTEEKQASSEVKEFTGGIFDFM